MRTIICFLFLAVVTIFFFSACMTTETQNYSESGPAGQEVLGYGILERISGQWNGPVITTTPAGSFNSWYVDFRPISYGEVAQYSKVDADTINYLNFFIVKHEGKDMSIKGKTGSISQSMCSCRRTRKATLLRMSIPVPITSTPITMSITITIT